jgi:hypothetical protein
LAGFYQDLVTLLRLAGCAFVRAGKGDHEIWYSPATQRHFKSRHTANETLKQAGLAKHF